MTATKLVLLVGLLGCAELLRGNKNTVMAGHDGGLVLKCLLAAVIPDQLLQERRLPLQEPQSQQLLRRELRRRRRIQLPWAW